MKAVRPYLPAKFSFRPLLAFRAREMQTLPVISVGNNRAVVVIDAKEIQRHLGDLHITSLNPQRFGRKSISQNFGILSLDRGINKPQIAKRMIAFRRSNV